MKLSEGNKVIAKIVASRILIPAAAVVVTHLIVKKLETNSED